MLVGLDQYALIAHILGVESIQPKIVGKVAAYSYNIKNDPFEHVNLASKMPDVLKNMRTKLQKYQATHFNPDRGSIWPGACDTALNKHGGVWGPLHN